MEKRKKAGNSCSVLGCRNNSANSPGTHFYAFSTLPHKQELRQKWINVLGRKNPDGSPWEPGKRSRICSRHFIGNKKSEHPLSPNYIPTIFPTDSGAAARSQSAAKQALARFERSLKRQTLPAVVGTSHTSFEVALVKEETIDHDFDQSLNVEIVKTDQSTQVDFLDESVNLKICICNRYFDGYNFEAQIQTNFSLIEGAPKRGKVKATTMNKRQGVEIKSHAKTVGSDSRPDSISKCNSGFHGFSSVRNDKEMLDLAGVTMASFKLLLKLLGEPDGSKVSKENCLLIFLFKMKSGIKFTALSVLFSTDESTVSKIFFSVLQHMSQACRYFVRWPSKEAVQAAMPDFFEKSYKDCRVIIDCMEIRVEPPSSAEERKKFYSHRKKDFRVKCLVGCTPGGFVSFVSKCYSGQTTDTQIIDSSGFLNHLEPGDIVLANEDFPEIKTALDESGKGCLLVMPCHHYDNHYDAEEVSEACEDESFRSYIERLLERIQIYCILSKFEIWHIQLVSQQGDSGVFLFPLEKRIAMADAVAIYTYARFRNARAVVCMKPGDRLNNSIGRATNLVEINLHDIQFKDIWQLGSFLHLLRRLEKLSIDWPVTADDDISLCRHILQRPFSKLTHLSVRLTTSGSTMFTSSLPLYQQLKELYMQSLSSCAPGIVRNSWSSEMKQLTNLKIVQYYESEAIRIKEALATVLPDPKRWTDFQLCGSTDRCGFYIEKDVKVCKELWHSRRFQKFLSSAPWEDFKFGWALNPARLLEEVLRITHQDVPEDLCCLSTFVEGRRHLLKVDEAKLLLRDPSYQISYLYLNHELDTCCDAHLLASAFPNLSELVLSAVIRNLEKSPKDSYFQRRLSRRCSPVAEKQDDSPNTDSSFKMLVENTPRLRHFTLNPQGLEQFEGEGWDLDALCLISGWQHLETLDIGHVPYEDSQFLIEIGKGCKNLQKVSLTDTSEKGGNQVALFEMFKYCRNLRDLTLNWFDVDQAAMFALLAKNAKLERVEVFQFGFGSEQFAAPWISSLENMIHQCSKLTTIICQTFFKTDDDLDEAASAVERIEKEFRRPDFQIRATCMILSPEFGEDDVGTVFEDDPQYEPFPLRFLNRIIES